MSKGYVLVISGLLLLITLVAGFVAGVDSRPPTPSPSTTLAVPSGPLVRPTYQGVLEFLRLDETNTKEYGEGYNCVEFALELVRKAHWHGYSAECLRVDFIDGVSHMLVVFPTSDSGFVWVEPQTDHVFTPPKVGDTYWGREVSKLEFLRLSWETYPGCWE